MNLQLLAPVDLALPNALHTLYETQASLICIFRLRSNVTRVMLYTLQLRSLAACARHDESDRVGARDVLLGVDFSLRGACLCGAEWT